MSNKRSKNCLDNLSLTFLQEIQEKTSIRYLGEKQRKERRKEGCDLPTQR